jgi:hypothetical protein
MPLTAQNGSPGPDYRSRTTRFWISCRIGAEYGAMSTLITNQMVLNVISQPMIRLLPYSKRATIARKNGRPAVTTLA